MLRQSIQMVWLLVLQQLLVLQLPVASGYHRPKLKECKLHPDLQTRIEKDLRIWRHLGGVTEQQVLNMQRMPCHHPDYQNRDPNACYVAENWNGKITPRFLISGGDVYLTHLTPKGTSTGHPDVVGFLVELYELSKVFELPDVEFAYFAQDEALGSQDLVLGPDRQPLPDLRVEGAEGPMLLATFSKKDVNVGLTVGCYSSIRCLSDFDAMAMRVDEFLAVHWERRAPVAFGRYNHFCNGYTNGPDFSFKHSNEKFPCVREWLHNLTKANKDKLDVGYINDAHDPTSMKFVPIDQQLGYKYLVSTDGWSISPKLERYMLMGSVVLKAQSNRISWFYDAMQPWKHYAPFMVDNATDILQVVDFLRSHDELARELATSAVEFALSNLTKEPRMCYLFTLLSELSKLFKYKPSCNRRKMCVPLVEELKWLHKHHPGVCKYAEVMMRYGRHDPLSVGFKMDLTPFHEDEHFMVWDDGVRNGRTPDALATGSGNGTAAGLGEPERDYKLDMYHHTDHPWP